MNINKCREINAIEHYEIINHINNLNANKLIDKYSLTNNSTIKLKHYKYNIFVIIHKNVKGSSKLQISYFDKIGAYSDIKVNTLHEAIKRLQYNYKIIEVI